MDILLGPETTTGPDVKRSARKTFFAMAVAVSGPILGTNFPPLEGREGELELIMHKKKDPYFDDLKKKILRAHYTCIVYWFISDLQQHAEFDFLILTLVTLEVFISRRLGFRFSALIGLVSGLASRSRSRALVVTHFPLNLRFHLHLEKSSFRTIISIASYKHNINTTMTQI